MSTQPQGFLTPEEYLRIEHAAERKSEYVNGRVYAMAGASPRHVLVAGNVTGACWSRLRGGPCRIYTSDLRLCVDETGLYTYPDVVIVCGEPRIAESDPQSITNPVVIFEVLSPSSEAFDRGGKFAHYRSLATLKEYMIVAQDAVRVEKYARQPDDSWLFTEAAERGKSIWLDSVGCELPVEEIYSNVVFENS